jgi:predicted nuclease of restriction endonuclease-like (RecB) superfamily
MKKSSLSRQEPQPVVSRRGQTKRVRGATGTEAAVVNEAALLSDLRELVRSARQRIATAAHSTQTMLCWYMGRRLLTENLKGSRAAYGQQILVTGSQQLSWSHIHALLPIKDPLARDFYAEMCRVERWDVRTLRQKIGGMLFQRTALSKKPKAVIAAEIARLRDGQMTPDLVFRDPYLLDLLGLKGAYSERDLEGAILREIEGVLLELGKGFAFVARQKRMSVGKDDFHLDLLFFHRHLRRLVAIELKLESFQPAHVGQMEFYLRWLDKHERAAGEEAPIGLILCAGADAEQVELLELNAKSIRVAEYLTELPPLPLLRQRLHEAIEHARERAAQRLPDDAGQGAGLTRSRKRREGGPS